MRKSLFTLLVFTLLVGFVALSYGENVVSLKQNPTAVSPIIKVDIQLGGGQGVAGYNSFIVFDAAVLKYVSATMGDYLPASSTFIRPLLREDGSYTLALDVDDTTKTGATIPLNEQQLSLSEFFFEIPPEDLPDFLGETHPELYDPFLRPGAKMWGISCVGSAPLDAEGIPVATDGDGTLVTLTFEMVDPQKLPSILLSGQGLFDSNDGLLPSTLGKTVITLSSSEGNNLLPEVPVPHPSDVNSDGFVNILDLTRVASFFGQPVSNDNSVADVNGDGEINILDLVKVAQDFGKFSVPTEPSDDIVSTPPMGPDENTRKTITIGVAFPLSGHLAGIGEIMRSGFDLAVEQLNRDPGHGVMLEYYIEDDKSTADGAVAAFETLIHTHGVSVILGPGSSSSARAAFPIAQENDVVAISPTAGARGLGAIGDFVFRTALTTSVVIPKGVERTQLKLGYQRVATLYDEDDLFSSDRDAALQLALANNGVEVLSRHTYKTGTTDFTAQLTRIKKLNPDALFVSALPPEKPSILIQAREAGISVPIIISSLTEAEVQAAGTAAEGAITFTGWLPTAETPGNRAFVEQYQKVYRTEPNAFAAATYACVHVFAEAVKNAENTDAQSIRDALARIQTLDTILGKFSFNENGDGVYKPNILIVRDGVLHFFD